VTRSEEQVLAVTAQQAASWFIANQSGSLEPAERAAFVAWLRTSPVHVEEYLGVALVAHDLSAAAEDPPVPLESLLELARAGDTDDIVQLETFLPVRDPAPKRVRTAHRWALATSIAATVLLAASVLWWVRGDESSGPPRTYRTMHG
jgi:transmembrane sensor